MSVKKPILLSVSFVAFIVACSAPDTWSAFGYPSAGALSDFRYLGKFESLDSCRAAVQAWRSGMGDSSGTDYECGKNCEGIPAPGVPVMCEATER